MSSHLKLSLKHEYKGAHGRIAIYFVNNAERAIISNLSIEVLIPPTTPAGSEVSTAPLQYQRIDKQVLQTVNPGQSFSHYLMFDLLHPFLQPPKYMVNFNKMEERAGVGTSEAVTLPLTLPVILTKFASAASYLMDSKFKLKQDFMAHFQSLEHEKHLVGCPKLVFPAEAASGYREVISILKGCNFHFEELDTGKFVACTKVCTLRSPSQNFANPAASSSMTMIPLFCRLDYSNSARVGLAVRSGSVDVTNSVSNILGSYLVQTDS